MLLRSLLASTVITLSLAATRPAHAEHFDVIYADHFDLTLCDMCGITLSGSDFALFANKGATPIDAVTFNSIQYTVVSTTPDLKLTPYAFTPGPSIMPIQVNEVVGNIEPVYPQNSILLTQLLPGEVFKEVDSFGTLGFTVNRLGPYEGPVTCHMTMQLGQDVASFDIVFDLHQGPHNIQFLSAARASSMIPTAAARTSWGKIKALYR